MATPELLEAVRWVPVDQDMPDQGMTVLVTLEGEGEPTWLGWHDGIGWCDVSTGGYFSGRVTGWAETLKGMGR